MSIIDVNGKAFFLDSRNFADLINGVVFDGKAGVDPKDLENMETEVLNGDEGKSYYVDVSKRWMVNGFQLSIITIENQTYVDYGMVVRNMVTESLGYSKQIKTIKSFHKKMNCSFRTIHFLSV